jgi:hypothetical protein
MKIDTVSVSDIHAPELVAAVGLPMWVLYDHPTDIPDRFVLRLWDALTNTATPIVFLSDTLEGIEKQINAVPGRFFMMERMEGDDPKIIGVFL